MDFSKEEVHQNGESPEENIVHPVGHRILLFVFDLVWHMVMDLRFVRHLDDLRIGARKWANKREIYSGDTSAGYTDAGHWLDVVNILGEVLAFE